MNEKQLRKYREFENATGFNFFNIPERTRKLLFISPHEPQSFTISISLSFTPIKNDRTVPDDPSTIYTSLPIFKDGYVQEVVPPSYYPSYSGLNPFQRRVYLEWLQNPATFIDPGYVFIYYYGLERHLAEGEFDLAFDEILFLSQHHPKIKSYSTAPLIRAALLRNRMDRLTAFLDHLDIKEIPINFLIMLAYYDSKKLDMKLVLELATYISGFNKRYYRERFELFEQTLSQLLTEKYNGPFLPFPDDFDLKDVPQSSSRVFCNISLSNKSYWSTDYLPLEHQGLNTALKNVFEATNNLIKSSLQERKKRTSKR